MIVKGLCVAYINDRLAFDNILLINSKIMYPEPIWTLFIVKENIPLGVLESIEHFYKN